MIYERIRYLCKDKNISINYLEKELEFGRGSLCKIDKNKPSVEKLQKIADYFDVQIDYLIGSSEHKTKMDWITSNDLLIENNRFDINSENTLERSNYYLNEYARQDAQFLFDNKEYKVLFDATKNVKKEDIALVKELLERFSKDK